VETIPEWLRKWGLKVRDSMFVHKLGGSVLNRDEIPARDEEGATTKNVQR